MSGRQGRKLRFKKTNRHLCHTQLIKNRMSYTSTFHNNYPEESFSDSKSEEDLTLTNPAVSYTENGAPAISLHGMTEVVRNDLTGLSLMSATITSGIDSEKELWGRLLGK